MGPPNKRGGGKGPKKVRSPQEKHNNLLLKRKKKKKLRTEPKNVRRERDHLKRDLKGGGLKEITPPNWWGEKLESLGSRAVHE